MHLSIYSCIADLSVCHWGWGMSRLSVVLSPDNTLILRDYNAALVLRVTNSFIIRITLVTFATKKKKEDYCDISQRLHTGHKKVNMES